jgi:hypothetical protein
MYSVKQDEMVGKAEPRGKSVLDVRASEMKIGK